MTLATTPFDAAEFLDSDEAIKEFVAVAFETQDAAFIARSLGVVAKARNMSELARETGMSRASLYKALSGQGNPEFSTIMKVMKALGIGLAPVMPGGRSAA